MQLQFQELQQYKIARTVWSERFFVHNKPNINSYNAREH